jgi:hypothetical protein
LSSPKTGPWVLSNGQTIVNAHEWSRVVAFVSGAVLFLSSYLLLRLLLPKHTPADEAALAAARGEFERHSQPLGEGA